MDDADQDRTKAPPSPAVFLSYTRNDADRVRPLIALLEGAGLPVWWDAMIEAGVRYVEHTENALENADAVVVAWSAQSVGSHWVRDEAMSGRDTGRLVPVALDGTLPPLGFRQFQVLDFSGWNGDPEAPVARELVRAVATLRGSAAALVARPAPIEVRPGPHATRRQSMAWIGWAGGAAALGAAGVGAWLWQRGEAPPGNSIAVLPFANDSGDPDQAYVASGLANELRAVLSRNPALRVVARSSSEAVVRRGLDAVSIARELGIAYIVEGTALVSGKSVRISSDLIDGASGLGTWSNVYTQPLDALLQLQQTLATEISAALSLDRSDGDLQLGTATVPAAYNAYLRGWELYQRGGETPVKLQALREFQEAARLDPGFAGARAGEAAALLNLGHGAENAADIARYYDAALVAARASMALGPDLDETHSVLAQALFEGKMEIEAAREPYRRSLELGPGSAGNQIRFAEYAALTGDDAAAVEAARRASELDPINPVIFRSAGLVDYFGRRYESSIGRQRQALALDPEFRGSHAWIASALHALGRLEEAQRECEAEPSPLLGKACLAVVARARGDAAGAEAALADLLERFGDASAYQQVQIFAQWGDAARALAALRLAVSIGDGGLVYMLRDPMLDPLRTNPEFIRLQREVGFR